MVEEKDKKIGDVEAKPERTTITEVGTEVTLEPRTSTPPESNPDKSLPVGDFILPAENVKRQANQDVQRRIDQEEGITTPVTDKNGIPVFTEPSISKNGSKEALPAGADLISELTGKVLNSGEDITKLKDQDPNDVLESVLGQISLENPEHKE